MPTDHRQALDLIIRGINERIAQLQSLLNNTHANKRQAVNGQIAWLQAKRDKIVARRDRLSA